MVYLWYLRTLCCFSLGANFKLDVSGQYITCMVIVCMASSNTWLSEIPEDMPTILLLIMANLSFGLKQ